MNIKANNRFLLLFTIFFPVIATILTIAEVLPSGWNLESVIPYLIFFIVGLLILRKERISVLRILPYNRGLRWQTALLIVLLVFLLMPLSEILSQLGAFVFGDMTGLAEQTGLYSDSPFFVTLFSVAMVPAIFEELYFRGFFYGAYCRAGGVRFAILLTAVLFGLFHANFQQALYAFVIGVVIAVLRELTGSIWAGMLYHFANNGFSVVMSRVDSGGSPAASGTIANPAAVAILTAVCTVAVFFVLLKISAIEGKKERFRTFFRGEKGEGVRIVTPCLIISILLNVAVAAFASAVLISGFLS